MTQNSTLFVPSCLWYLHIPGTCSSITYICVPAYVSHLCDSQGCLYHRLGRNVARTQSQRVTPKDHQRNSNGSILAVQSYLLMSRSDKASHRTSTATSLPCSDNKSIGLHIVSLLLGFVVVSLPRTGYKASYVAKSWQAPMLS
jgi:hypothetical protein